LLVLGLAWALGKAIDDLRREISSNRTSDERRVERGSSELKELGGDRASGKSASIHG